MYLLQAVLLVAFCCHTATAADSKSPVPNTKPAQQLSSVKEPRNIEEEYYNVPVHSVLGEKPAVPLSNGKIINSLSEFDIVYEGPATHTGDLNLTTPLFSKFGSCWVAVYRQLPPAMLSGAPAGPAYGQSAVCAVCRHCLGAGSALSTLLQKVGMLVPFTTTHSTIQPSCLVKLLVNVGMEPQPAGLMTTVLCASCTWQALQSKPNMGMIQGI